MLDNGDSSLIISPKGKSILIDGGEDDQNVLLPYLLARKVRRLDYIIISHFDSDHIGGLFTVMENLNVNRIVISKQKESCENYEVFKEIIKKRKIKVLVVDIGDKLQIEKNLYLDILWPDNSKQINENVLNNNSIVCKLNYNNFSCIFTGDIEEIAEKQIVKYYKKNLKVLDSTILKVAHHGSNTSSTEDFLIKINPKIALIGVGKNNKFGHPNEEVIRRLKDIRD